MTSCQCEMPYLLYVKDRTWSECVDQFSLPDATNLQFVPDRLNVTLHFTSPTWVTVADGTGRLYLLHSGDRTAGNKWKVHVPLLFSVISLVHVD